ncbi:MAG: porin [Gammaproteobacteria bacterium]
MKKLTTGITGISLAVISIFNYAHAGGVTGGNANSNWQIYGWQNWSYEFVDNDERDIQRISNNAANIGFSASIDTGMSMGGQAIKANFRCEQFTFHNRFSGSGFGGYNDFCNRNSKISLSGTFGEFMIGQWLLPHNEMVAAWVDPFYDAGADSHSSIMGSVGYGTRFFNGGFGFDNGGGFGGDLAFDNNGFGSENNAFNRRQNGLLQYWSPNINGFQFRIATTNAQQDEGFQYFSGGNDISVTSANGTEELDPRIWSTGVAYENTLANGDNIWFAATYEIHDDWAAVDFACEESDDTSWRLAGRYIKQWGNGMFTRVSAMYEDLEYEHEGCARSDGALGSHVLGSSTGVAGNVTEVERSAWMVSGIQNFGNGLDFRFSYMDADEFDCGGTTNCNGVGEDDTDATAFNLGLFYTMPAGTELRVTYSEVNNEDNAQYDFGISPAGVAAGDDLEMIALGIVQWF